MVFTTSPNEANAAAGHILNPLSVASNGTFTDANLAMRFVYLILLNYRTDLAATLSRYTCAEKRRVIQGHLWPLGRNMASWFLATGETSQQHQPASQCREVKIQRIHPRHKLNLVYLFLVTISIDHLS